MNAMMQDTTSPNELRAQHDRIEEMQLAMHYAAQVLDAVTLGEWPKEVQDAACYFARVALLSHLELVGDQACSFAEAQWAEMVKAEQLT